MRRTGLEFAPGTTEDCKKFVTRLFTHADVFGAYHVARNSFKSSDIVLISSESDPSGFDVKTRHEYLNELRLKLGHLAPVALHGRRIVSESAQQVMSLPRESDALWLIITRVQALPIEVVIYATPYEITGPETSEGVLS